jgi:hypothetical protein
MRIGRLSLEQWFGVGVVLVVVTVLLFPAIQRVAWAGHTDLEIELTVADAATGKPVPGANDRRSVA